MNTEKRRVEFNSIDKDGSGIIEFKEWYKHFDALIRQENSTWTTEKLLKMYKEFEGDSKGIDFEEYCTFMDAVFEKPRAEAKARAQVRAKRKEEFNNIDKDSSGIIEFKEWYKHFDALIRQENSTWTAEKLLKMYREFEGDSEGIDFEEYCIFMDAVFEKPRAAARARAKVRAERKEAFKVIDKNDNGIIEFKEWYKHFDALIRKENSTWTAEKLLTVYKSYKGDDKGINFEEYSKFMDDVFGE